MTYFTAALGELMDQAGLTQSTLAAQTGLSQTAISNYLSGNRRPGADELLKLAHFFGVSMESLLSSSGSPVVARPVSLPESTDWKERALAAERKLRDAARRARNEAAQMRAHANHLEALASDLEHE